MEYSVLETMIRNRVASRRKWAAIFVAVAVIVMGALYYFKYLEVIPVNNVEDFVEQRKQMHPYVRLENAYLYDCGYALTETETQDGKVTSKKDFSYFLYLDENEEEYRMFLVQLKGTIYGDIENCTVEGTLKKLTKTDEEVVQELIADYGLYDEDIIVTGVFREAPEPETTGWFYFVSAGLIGVVALVFVIAYTITCTKPGNVGALRKAREQYESIVHNMENAAHGDNVVFHDSQLLIAGGGIFGFNRGWFFTPLDGLMLASLYRITHRTNGIKTGVETIAKLYFSDRTFKQAKMGSTDLDSLYINLVAKCPNVLVIADKKLEKLFKKDFERFRAEVVDRLKVQTEEIKQMTEESQQTEYAN